MLVSAISQFPKMLAIIANVKDGIEKQLIELIQKKAISVIAVDGGFNLCDSSGIRADYLVGDLDSVELSAIDRFPDLKIIQFPRAKNTVDLEEGIQLASRIDASAIICIFNALYGRKDHHLSNLYLLYKYSQAAIITNDAIVASSGGFAGSNYFKTLQHSIYAYYGDVLLSSQKCVKSGELKTVIPRKLQVIEGEALSIFSQYDVDVSKVTLHDIKYPFSDEYEEMILVCPDQTAHIDACVGLTISLIPWRGPVMGLHTKGLKWEFIGGELDKEFVGVSNIAISQSVSIKLEKGLLLCIVEKKIVDEEMVELPN